MKVKLLKKIRKTFNWYIDKKGISVLLFLKIKKIIIVDESFIRSHLGYKKDEEFTIPLNELSFKALKNIILKKFGYEYINIMFNKATRLSRTKNRSL